VLVETATAESDAERIQIIPIVFGRNLCRITSFVAECCIERLSDCEEFMTYATNVLNRMAYSR